MSRFSFWTRLLILLLFPLLTGADCCSDLDHDIKVGLEWEEPDEDRARSPRARAPRDRYLAFDANKKADGTGFGFQVVPRDLWAPFDYYITGGIFLEEKLATTDGAVFCTELDERGSEPLVFWVLCAQRTGGGLNVFANAQGTTIGTPVFFTGAAQVEFSVEADGTELIFAAREPGVGAATEIARTPFSAAAQTVPLVASVGASSLGAKAQVGFDDLMLLANAAPPGPLTPEKQLVETLWAAAGRGLAGYYALDGASPDINAARNALTAGSADLADAQGQADALTPSKDQRKVAKAVAKAAKQVGKALAALDKTKVDKAMKKIEKAAKQGGKAIQRLEPFTLQGE